MDNEEKSCLLCEHIVSGGGGEALVCELYSHVALKFRKEIIRDYGHEVTLETIAEYCRNYRPCDQQD